MNYDSQQELDPKIWFSSSPKFKDYFAQTPLMQATDPIDIVHVALPEYKSNCTLGKANTRHKTEGGKGFG